MEALVILGLAANVVQFVDFAQKVVSKTSEIYRSADGAVKEHVDLRHIAERTRALAEALTQTHPSTDPELNQISTDCSRVAGEMLEALTKTQIHGPHTPFRSARKALKSVWGKDKITHIEHSLRAFRDQLNLHICVRLRGQIDSLSLNQSEAFRHLDEASRARVRHIVDAIEGTKALFAQSLADHTQQTRLSQKEAQLSILEALRISDEEATLRHNIARQTQLSTAETFSHRLNDVCAMQSSSAFVLDNISRNTIDIKAAITASTAHIPVLLQPMVEGAVQRSLARSRTALNESMSEQGKSSTAGLAGGTCLPTSLAINSMQLARSYPNFNGVGRRKQRTERATYKYRLGSVTLIQHHTERLDGEGTNAPVLTAKQTTVLVSFNTWFLKMAVAIQYGTAIPTFGDPLLNLRLRAHYLVDSSSPIVQAIHEGNYATFRQLLTDRKATPFDEVIGEKTRSTLFAELTRYFHNSNYLADDSSKASALLQMAQLLVESGVDCGLDYPLTYLLDLDTGRQAGLASTLLRMILSHSKSDPFGKIWDCIYMQRDLKAIIVGQDEWDTTTVIEEVDLFSGRGAWQRMMVEGVDQIAWRLEQSVAWKQEPHFVRHSYESCKRKYGERFCYEPSFVILPDGTEQDLMVCQWLRLRWRELRPSVRHSLQACREQLKGKWGEEIKESMFKRLCEEERWKEEPQEVRLSREETKRRYGWDFVARWYLPCSWDYLLAEERSNLYEELGRGTPDDEALADATSVDENSFSDAEYDTADEA